MGRIKGRDQIKEYMKKYSGGGVDYFSLKDDGDTAKVRILHEDDSDLEVILVHKVEVEGNERWIECLEEDCPFCETYTKPTIKLFIILYDHADEKLKCWERGPSMLDQLFGFIDRYGHLNNRDYDIVRHGKKGNKKTTYQLFPGDEKGPIKDSKGNEIEMPERPKVYGRFVLQMTKEEMLDHIADNAPVQRDRVSKGKENLVF